MAVLLSFPPLLAGGFVRVAGVMAVGRLAFIPKGVYNFSWLFF